MKKKRPLQISFYNDGHGWISLKLNLPEKSISIKLSDCFDPFPDIFRWIEDICENDMPSEIIIDEEGHGKRLVASVLTKEAKESFLLKIFDWGTEKEKLLVKSELLKYDFIMTLINRLESFVKRHENLKWDTRYELRELPFNKIKRYFKNNRLTICCT